MVTAVTLLCIKAYAATYGHTDVAKMLCDATTTIEQESMFGETPLMCAAQHDFKSEFRKSQDADQRPP